MSEPRPRSERTGRVLRRFTAAIAVVAIGLSGPAALGQSAEELAKARTLFREGVALSAANNWSGALAKFQAVAQVKMTPQVAFNIAECEEHLGKLNSALGNYRLAASEAQNPDAKAAEVAKQVDARISALEARIPKLTIKRGEGAESASIELDGTEIGSSQLGTPIPVDPGPHVVLAKVNGKEASRETIKLEEKQSKTYSVVIDLEELQGQGSGPVPGGDTTDPKPDKPEGGGSKVPGIVVLSIGGASLAAGVVFMILRQGAISDLDAACGNDTTCPASAESTADQGKLYTGLAEVTIPVGVVGIIAGAVLIATSGGGGKPATPAASGSASSKLRFVGAAPGATIGGASLVGRF